MRIHVILYVVESSMKLWGNHCCNYEILVSKDNHKNVTVYGEIGQTGKQG